MNKKYLSLFMVFVMILSLFNGMNFTSYADADPELGLSVLQLVDDNNPKSGETFTYTIKYGTSGKYNSGNILNGLKLKFTAYDGLDISSYDKSGDIDSVTENGNELIFNFKDNITIGTSGILKVIVKFKEGVTPMGASDSVSQSELYIGDNSSIATSETVTVSVDDINSIDIDKTFAPNLPSLNNYVYYTIRVTGENRIGGRNLTDVSVTDTLPSGVTDVEAVNPNTNVTIVDNVITWDNQELNVGEVKEYVLRCKYPDTEFTAGPNITNTATITGTHIGEVTSISGTDTAVHTFYAATIGNPSIVKQNRPGIENGVDEYGKGQKAKFRIFGINNPGNIPLDKLEVLEILPTEAFKLTSFYVGNYNVDPTSMRLLYTEENLVTKGEGLDAGNILPDTNKYRFGEDVVVNIDDTKTFSSLELDGGVLTQDTDYSIVGSVLTINGSALTSGDHSIEVKYDDNSSSVADFTIGNEYKVLEDNLQKDTTVTIADSSNMKAVKLEINGVPVGFNITSPVQVRGDVIADEDDTKVYTNSAKLTLFYNDEESSNADPAEFKVTGAMPRYDIDLSTDRASYDDSEDINYNLIIKNADLAKGNVHDENGVIIAADFNDDFEIFNYTGFTFIKNSENEGNYTATVEEMPDEGSYKRWKINGTLKPGDYVKINFTNSVVDGKHTGNYGGRAFILENGVKDTDWETSDTVITGEQVNTDLSASSLITDTCSIFNKFHGSVGGVKNIKGELDADYVVNIADGANTTAGGFVDYKIKISNATGNGPVSNIVVIDKLPMRNDTHITNSNSRGSQWTPYLIGEAKVVGDSITDGVTGNLKIYYSTKPNPSKTILTNSTEAVNLADWSLTAPENIIDVTHILLDLDGYVLENGDYVEVEFRMVAPVGTALNSKAYNSFAYGATYPEKDGPASFLATEPSSVFHEISGSGSGFGIGSRVFYDVNHDGLDNESKGINGIKTILYKENNGSLERIRHTYSNKNVDGEDGYFLFPKTLDSGNYDVLFLVPKSENLILTKNTKFRAITDLTDYPERDDIDTTKYDVYSYEAESGYLGLSGDDTDAFMESATIGLYRKTTVSGKVFNDLNHNGVKDAGEDFLSGVTVTLTNESNPAEVLTTTTNASGEYAFEGLDPKGYRLKVDLTGTEYDFSPKVNSGAVHNEFDNTGILINSVSDDEGVVKNAGIHKSIINGNIWFDSNYNGTKNAEPNLSGFTVELFLGDVSKGTVTTTANGNYLFNDLDPGTYKAVITTADADYKETIKSTEAFAANKSFVDSGEITNIVVGKAVKVNNVGAGYYKDIKINGLLFNDINHNGLKDAEESVRLKDGVDTITITISGGDLSDPITTTATYDAGVGGYVYDVDMKPSANPYVISYDNPDPSNLSSSKINVPNGNVFSDGDDNKVTYTLSNPVSAPAGKTYTLNSGLHKGMISIDVFEDMDYSGVKNGTETFLSDIVSGDVVLVLVDSEGNETTITPTTMNSKFNNLDAGDYTLKVKIKTGKGYKQTKDNDATKTVDGEFDVYTYENITVGNGNEVTLSKGFFKPATIVTKVFFDKNYDGKQIPEEDVANLVTKVELFQDGASVGEFALVENTDNSYTLGDLNPGTYTIKYTPAEGHLVTKKDQGNDDTIDSDVSSTKEINVTLISGQTLQNTDLGLYKKVVISGTVFEEKGSVNGVLDGSDVLYTGELVITVYDEDGNTIKNVTVNVVDGNYSFELDPGSYKLKYRKPDGMLISSGMPVDENGDIDVNDLESGTPKTIDLGIYEGGTVKGHVYYDKNANDTEDAGEELIASKIYLLDSDGNILDSVDSLDGTYEFNGLKNGDYKIKVEKLGFVEPDDVTVTVNPGDVAIKNIGIHKTTSVYGNVFLDKNRDGINFADTPFSDVEVKLNKPNDETETISVNPDGTYEFVGLTPGTYSVEVIIPADKDYYRVSPKDQGTDEHLDSDVDPNTKSSEEFVIASDGDGQEVGIGIYRILNITGTLTNFDGDAIEGAKIHLLDDDGNPILDENGDPIIVETDSNGDYSLTDLYPGSYKIKVVSYYTDDEGNTIKYPDIIKDVIGLEGGNLVKDFVSSKYQISFVAEPEIIVGDGVNTSELTFTIKNEDGTPVSNKSIKFTANNTNIAAGKEGKFTNDSDTINIITDAEGKAVTDFISADLRGYLEPKEIEVTAEAIIDGRTLTDYITMIMEPISISGKIKASDGTVYPNADIEIHEQINTGGTPITPDMLIDKNGYTLTQIDANTVQFDYVGKTDNDGKYKIYVPFGNHEYTVDIQVSAEDSPTGNVLDFEHKANVVDGASGTAINVDSDKTIVGTITIQKPGEPKKVITGESVNRITIQYSQILEDGTENILNYTLGEDGVINITNGNLEDRPYKRTVYYQLDPDDPNSRVAVSEDSFEKVDNGDIIIEDILIDPYGTITDFKTGQPIVGARVELFFEDGTRVVLPPSNLALSNNVNPQMSIANGKYAWMVFPNKKYYIIATKPGYYTYDSRTNGGVLDFVGDGNPPQVVNPSNVPFYINVVNNIAQWDFKMKRLPSNTEVTDPVENEDDGTYLQDIKAEKNIIYSGEDINLTVNYINKTDTELENGYIKIKIPAGLDVVATDNITVKDGYILYKVSNLKPDELNTINIKVSTKNVKETKVYEFESVLLDESYNEISDLSHAFVSVYYVDCHKAFKPYIYGRPDGGFHKYDNITRAEVAAILVRNTYRKNAGKEITFNDVNKEEWFYNEVMMAAKYGYFDPDGMGNFRPDEFITRGELAEALVKFLDIDSNKESAAVKYFSDIDTSIYKKDINIIARNNIVNGYPDGTFRPNNLVNRSEAVKMFNNILYRVETPDVERSFNDVTKEFWAFGHIESAFRGFIITNKDGNVVIQARDKINPYYDYKE